MLATVLPERLGGVLHVERAGDASIHLVDRQGRLVFRYPEIPLSWEQRGRFAEIPLLAAALRHEETVGSFVSPLAGDRRLAGLVPVHDIGWVVIASQSEAEVMARVNTDALYSWGLLLAVTLAGVLLAIYFGRTITEPARQAREYAQALARGDFSRRIAVSGPIELREVVDAFTRMAEQLHLRQQQLRESEERLRLVVANSPDTVFYQDCDLRYVWFGGMAPIDADQVLGKTDFDLFGAEQARRLTETKRRVIDSATGARGDLDLAIGGRKRHYEAVYAPRLDDTGRVIGIFGYVHDVTERAELDRLKEEFISVAAHELKTPVAVMKGYAQALLRAGEPVSPKGRKMLEAIDRGSNRIDAVVEDLLDVSNLQAGRLELAMGPVDLPALVADAANCVGSVATKHRIRIVQSQPAVVRGNRKRLEQVLLNLLRNAVKYSPEGGDIDVAVTTKDREAVVSVRDYGVGIPKEKQGRIFQRFYSAHTGTPYDFGGLGTALFISSQLVIRHGGKMWFESEPGKGSVFYFSVPAVA